MAAQGTIMVQDDAVVTVGQARGWKIGFGSSVKGTVVSVYVVAENSGVTANATEIPLLPDGKADVDAVTAYLSSFGVVLADAVKQVIGV